MAEAGGPARSREKVVVMAENGDMVSGGCTEANVRGFYSAIVDSSGGAEVVASAEVSSYPHQWDVTISIPVLVEKIEDVIQANRDTADYKQYRREEIGNELKSNDMKNMLVKVGWENEFAEYRDQVKGEL